VAKRRFDLVAFRARLKVYDSLFNDRNHKAFSRFCLYPGEKSGLDEQTPGHGLGLAIVRDIVTRYEGKISFSTKSGSGLRVFIEFSK